MRTLLLLSILLWFPSQVVATALIALRTASQIVLAADSKTVTIEGFEGKRCKTVIAPNHIFAASGIVEQIGTFNSFRIGKRLLSTSASHFEIVTSYKNEMLRILPVAIKKIRHQAPQYFETKVRGREAFQAVFGSSEGGVLRVSVMGFIPSDDGSISVRQQDCPGRCDATQAWFISLGEHVLIDAEVRNNPHIWANLGIVGAINRLIDMEIEGRPRSVGKPISVVTLHQDGQLRWNQLGECDHQ